MAAKSVSDLIEVCGAGDLTAVKLLIAQGVSVNESSSKGWTPLHNSSCEGHLAVVKELLKNGADVNGSFRPLPGGKREYKGGLFTFLSQGGKLLARDNEGYNPLMLASGKGHREIVDILLVKGAKVDAKNNGGDSSMILASYGGHTDVVDLLLSKGADIHAMDNDGNNPLMLASGKGHREIVDILLLKGAEVDAKNNGGSSSLMAASQNGNTEVVDLLLSKGADIHAKNNGGFSSLIVASYGGHTDVVDLLLSKGADIHAMDNDGFSSLHLASQNGHTEVVDLLLSKGADIHARTNIGYNPLMLASGKGHREIVDILLLKGAKVDAKNNGGDSSMILASYGGHTDVVDLLLSKGADIHAMDNNGDSSMILASYVGHTDVVDLLLSKGADIHAMDNNGSSSLMVASEKGHPDVVDLLLSKGADIHAKNNNGSSSLHRASQNGHPDVVNLLLSKGANIHAKNNKGSSSLMGASYGGHLEVVDLLLSKGADIHAKNNDGSSSLMVASEKGHPYVVDLLLSKGADIHAMDNDGSSSLMVASEKGHPYVVDLLLSKGADIHAMDNDRFTALHYASQEGHVPVAETLLSHGANLEIKTNMGNRLTPVGLASVCGAAHMVEFLVQQGAVLDAGDRMPVDLAAKEGNKDKKAEIKKILTRPELNFKGGDDGSKSWSAQERLSLIRSCNTRILTAGELKSGKTSLARSIISKTQYRAALNDRTVVVEQRQWQIGAKTIPIVDLGGHKSYRVTGMFFLTNAPNNVVLLCHDIQSDRYILTYHWIMDIICQAPEAHIIPVLTMTDKLPPEENQTLKERFVQEISRHLRLEIESLESKLAQTTKKDTKHKIRKIIDCYHKLLTAIPNSLLEVSTAPLKGETIEHLKKEVLLLSNNSENQIEIPALYEAFYSKIGCMGTKATSNLELNPSSSALEETPSVGAISVEDDLDDKQTYTQDEVNKAGKCDFGTAEAIGAYNTSTESSTQKRAAENLGTSMAGSQSYDDADIEPVKRKKYSDTENTTSSKILQQLGNQLSPEKKLLAKPYLQFEEVKTIFEETEKEMMGEQGPLQHDVRKCLSILHKLGIIMWFEGTKTLENYVFHKHLTVTAILKAVFHHEADNFLDYSRLTKQDKRRFNNEKSNFTFDVNLLHRRGIMTKEILQTLLRHNECKLEDDDFLLDLFQRLDIAFKLEPTDKRQSTYEIFIPYFNEDKVIPTHVIKKIEDAKISNDGSVVLKCCVSGNISQTYFNKVLVQIYKDVELFSALKDVWGKGVFMEEESLRCIVTYDAKEQIEIITNGLPKFLPKMWKMIQKITRGTRGLQEEWYPGLIEAFYMLCPCQHQYAILKTAPTSTNHESCRLDLEKVLESPETLPPWYCRNTRELIPAAYYTPVQEDASEMIKKVESFVEKLLQGKVQVIEEWRILALETMHPDPVILKLCAEQVLSLEDKHQFEGKDVYSKVQLLLDKVDSSRKQQLVTALEATDNHSNVSLAQFITGNCIKEETFLSEKDVGSILKEFSEVFVEIVDIDDIKHKLFSKCILDQSQWEELSARQTRTKKASYLLDHILLRGTVQTVCGFYSAIYDCQLELANSLEKAVPNIIAKIDNV